MVEDPWHFTPVIALNNCLSSGAERLREIEATPLPVESPSSLLSSPGDYQNPPGLGNFDKIWRYLNLPLSVPSVKTESKLEVAVGAARTEDLSDKLGANKGVRWWDGTESADLADKEETTDGILAIGIVKGLTKKERRRKRREEIEGRSSPQKEPPQDTEKRYNLRQPRPRSATEAVIQRLLSDSVALPQSPSPVSRIKGKLGATSDHEKQPVTPLRLLKRSPVEYKSDDQSAYKIAAEKKEHLIKKLRATFPEEQKSLDKISVLSRLDESTDETTNSIHVFVDASNIMIGFQDSLKRSLGIPVSRRIRTQPFSFHNLSLILERGRPVAKRVLAGSDNFPAIQEAKLIGYETNILERVHKAKELTPRKKKNSSGSNNYNNSSSSSSNYTSATGQSSSSETATAGFAPEKWVEQAVDEILHLKILESVVDAKTPSTIVLATGDAAEAEYSEGFLKMVERALEKGWMVELVSFKHNISGAYKRKEFRGKWEGKFKIIILDEYVEMLMGS